MHQTTTAPLSFDSMIGEARYQRYLEDARQDQELAQELYRWNTEASGAFYELLTTFELLLRNTLDRELSAWNEATYSPHTVNRIAPDNPQSEPSAWTLNTSPVIWRVLRGGDKKGALKSAYKASKTSIERTGRLRQYVVTHDDMVAHMTFGNWIYLLPSRRSQDRRTLWEQAICKGFPGWDAAAWMHLTRRVSYAHQLRNRISHLEPITHANLRQTRRGIRKVAYSMGRSQYQFLTSHDRTRTVLDRFPLQPNNIDWRDIAG